MLPRGRGSPSPTDSKAERVPAWCQLIHSRGSSILHLSLLQGTVGIARRAHGARGRIPLLVHHGASWKGAAPAGGNGLHRCLVVTGCPSIQMGLERPSSGCLEGPLEPVTTS